MHWLPVYQHFATHYPSKRFLVSMLLQLFLLNLPGWRYWGGGCSPTTILLNPSVVSYACMYCRHFHNLNDLFSSLFSHCPLKFFGFVHCRNFESTIPLLPTFLLRLNYYFLDASVTYSKSPFTGRTSERGAEKAKCPWVSKARRLTNCNGSKPVKPLIVKPAVVSP